MKTKNKAPELSGKIEVAEDLDKTEKNIKEKDKFTIFGIEAPRIVAYFVIYSIIGIIIET